MGALFNAILVKPILNLLVLGYVYIPGHDLGVVILVVTVLIRLLLAPSFHKSLKSQHSMAAIQPKMNEVREKYKDDKEAQARAMMALYKEHKINPLGSCLPLLIQLPLLWALYKVFLLILQGNKIDSYLYSFVHSPATFNPVFLGIVNLAKPSIALGVIAGLVQFWQSRMMLPKQKSNDATQNAMAVQTTYILPLLTVIISIKLPAGLPLYWIATTLFVVAQQYYIIMKNKEKTAQNP